MVTKELLVVAGPNGSGKTTFAEEFLAERTIPYVSADLIAMDLAEEDLASRRFTAGRKFFQYIERRLAGTDSFLIESTLSGRSFRRIIEDARVSAFQVTIMFVYLDSADTCVARVKERVCKGGHNVPEADVRRRFSRSLRNFWQTYRKIADHWVLVYNAKNEFQNVAIGSGDGISVRDETLFNEFFGLAGGIDIDG